MGNLRRNLNKEEEGCLKPFDQVVYTLFFWEYDIFVELNSLNLKKCTDGEIPSFFMLTIVNLTIFCAF